MADGRAYSKRHPFMGLRQSACGIGVGKRPITGVAIDAYIPFSYGDMTAARFESARCVPHVFAGTVVAPSTRKSRARIAFTRENTGAHIGTTYGARSRLYRQHRNV